VKLWREINIPSSKITRNNHGDRLRFWWKPLCSTHKWLSLSDVTRGIRVGQQAIHTGQRGICAIQWGGTCGICANQITFGLSSLKICLFTSQQHNFDRMISLYYLLVVSGTHMYQID
jgi:hypothetical protein